MDEPNFQLIQQYKKLLKEIENNGNQITLNSSICNEIDLLNDAFKVFFLKEIKLKRFFRNKNLK